MGYVSQLIKHADISEENLKDICSLKSIRWDYTLEQHHQWMINNVKQHDYHVLIRQDGMLVAYANLVDIMVTINGKDENLKGLGNVCTRETGKGYGNILMKEVNGILESHLWKGLLLCKSALVDYYKKFLWELLERKNINPSGEYLVKYMVFNLGTTVYNFEFRGKAF